MKPIRKRNLISATYKGYVIDQFPFNGYYGKVYPLNICKDGKVVMHASQNTKCYTRKQLRMLCKKYVEEITPNIMAMISETEDDDNDDI